MNRNKFNYALCIDEQKGDGGDWSNRKILGSLAYTDEKDGGKNNNKRNNH